MKAPISWLRELVNLPAETTTAQIAEKYTALGLTVEHVISTGPDVSGPLTVGRVLSFVDEPQKNGKVIRWCRVDVGEELNDPATEEYPASRGIVCGAHNFAEGDLVVVALPGTVLPGDFAIAARKTYGHVSDGMICSSLELGLGDDHDGIIVLGPELGAKPGDSGLDLLWSVDEVLDIDVTSDLSHGLSIRGLAREIAEAHGVSFEDPYSAPMPENSTAGYPVVLESERCVNFVALTIEGFDPTAPSPKFIADRLLASGVRSISLPVDVTNYVMLESGQPLHAYDAAKLQGAITVRQAVDGEVLRTLDGVDRKLVADDLLITDESGPIGLAGVMGGETTEVSDTTTAIVLEAAHFASASVSRTFRRHGLGSEASKRFERTVDPAVPYAAARRAAELLVKHGGGSVREEYTYVGSVPATHRLNVRAGLVSAVLGAEVPASETVRILQGAGVRVTAMGDSLSLEVPSWRPDLRDPYDVVEEVGRKFGYDRIGLRIPVPPAGGGLTKAQRDRRRVTAAVAALGFTEVLSLPFVSVEDLDRLGVTDGDERRQVVRLANPLDDTHPFMRTTLLTGLFKAVARNTSRSIDDVALFERGSRYLDAGTPAAPRPSVAQRPSDDELAALEAALPAQPETLAAVVAGNWIPAGWQGAAIPADWRHVVAFAETAAASVGLRLSRANEDSVMPWHPGRCARLLVDGQTIGFAGELHPSVIKAHGLPARTCAVEFDLGLLLELAPNGGNISALSGFPVAKEDVALVVDEAVPAADVQAALVEGAGELLEEVRLFDVYHGEQIGEGKKSLAFALRFRADRTLKDAEAAQARDAAVAVAVERFGAVQRA